MIPRIEQALAPSSDGALMKVLIENAPSLGLRDIRAEQWASMFETYLTTLAGMPAGVLVSAFGRWHRAEPYPDDPGRCGFYPHPAEIFALCEKSKGVLVTALYRARKALEWADKQPPPPKTAEQRAAERAELIAKGYMNPDGSMNVSFGHKTIPPANRPAPGDSPQLLAERTRAAAEPKPPSPDDLEDAV